MSYRSRLFNHRNAQPPEGEKQKKPFFSAKRGAGAGGNKKKFFQHGPAAAMPEEQGPGVVPKVQRLATSDLEEQKGTNEEKQARNKGDKLRQKDTGGGGAGGPQEITAVPGGKKKIQRDLALPPTTPDAVDPVLTPKQIHDAILFNNNRFGPDSIRLIQNIVGATVDGVMGPETIHLIAHYQAQNGLTPDGMVGPNSFDQLTDELGAENASPDTCLTSFLVALRTPMTVVPGAAPGTVDIFGHFDIQIRFDPHCDCSRFEYRQFIGGDVTLNGANINGAFSVPGGGLPGLGNFVEDGNTTLPNNGRIGHRNLPGNQGFPNEYFDTGGVQNMPSGCLFHATDEPGVNTPNTPGNVLVFDIRFFGDIRRDGAMVERKFWAVRQTITL